MSEHDMSIGARLLASQESELRAMRNNEDLRKTITRLTKERDRLKSFAEDTAICLQDFLTNFGEAFEGMEDVTDILDNLQERADRLRQGLDDSPEALANLNKTDGE